MTMDFKNFIGIARWELEENLSLPVIVFLIVSAIISTLAQPVTSISPELNFVNLYHGSDTIFLFLTFSACAFLSRSFAGSIGRGETKLLLSYPVKRWQLFLSKFMAMFFAVFFIYGAAYSVHLYLDSLSLLEPMFYLTLFVFLLQLMFVCVVTVAISMLVKNEIMSLFASILLLLGFDNIVGIQSYISTHGRFRVLFGYFGELTHETPPFGDTFIVTADDVLVAILGPVLVFAVLIVLSFVYFVRFMEVD
jgi:ABC-type transport system involved in multi-copper enzyme maturation permease subunit